MSELCPVAVVQDSTEDEYQPETAGESHLLLLKQKKYCDVTFTFPNLPDKIEAHEFCLKARSPVFAKIFRMRKSGNVQGSEIEISESTPEIFQQFLEFIYTDKFEAGIAEALDLLRLAEKYKVHPLTKKCEELLQTKIPINDSVKVFETARHYGRRELMDRAGQIMVESFLELVGTGALANAEEETFLYLLESDDLAVQEVGLFQFIVDWGRKQVGTSGDDGLLKSKLKNLIPKIRYTNMASGEFTKVVVPTGLLSAEETISVYSYLSVDEITRGGLQTKFNTTRRKVENQRKVKTFVHFPDSGFRNIRRFPAFSKHCISFKAHRAQVDGKALPDYLLKKTVITAIHCFWPAFDRNFSKQHVLNFDVSIREYSGPMKEEDLTTRFHKKLMSCEQDSVERISVEPPVELVPGRMYSVIIEDHSTSDLIDNFRKTPNAYLALPFDMKQDSKIDVKQLVLTLKDINCTADYYDQQLSDRSVKMSLIKGLVVGLM